MALQSLPQSLLEHVCLFLELRDIRSIRQTCRLYRSMLDLSFLKHHLLSYAADVRNPCFGCLPEYMLLFLCKCCLKFSRDGHELIWPDKELKSRPFEGLCPACYRERRPYKDPQLGHPTSLTRCKHCGHHANIYIPRGFKCCAQARRRMEMLHMVCLVMWLALELATSVVTCVYFWHDKVMSVPLLVLVTLQTFKWLKAWAWRFESRTLGWQIVFLGLWTTSLTKSFLLQTVANTAPLHVCQALLIITTALQCVHLLATLFCRAFPFTFYRRAYNWLPWRQKILFWIASALLVWVNPRIGRLGCANERLPYSKVLWDMAHVALKGVLYSGWAVIAIVAYPVLLILERFGINLV